MSSTAECSNNPATAATLPPDHEQYRHQVEQYSLNQCFMDWVKFESKPHTMTAVPPPNGKTVHAWYERGDGNTGVVRGKWADTDSSVGGFCSTYGNPQDAYGFWVDPKKGLRGRWDRKYNESVVEGLGTGEPRRNFTAASTWADQARKTAKTSRDRSVATGLSFGDRSTDVCQ